MWLAMKTKDTKDTIAIWLLVLFVAAPFAKAFYGFIDALKRNCPASIILWFLGVSLVVAASGLFLIVHSIYRLDDLRH
jgi:hypothetical protein